MRVKVLAEQLWRSHRGALILLGVLFAVNLLMVAVVEQLLVPEVAEQENRFLKRQTEVRALLRNQGSADMGPERLFLLASQDLSRFKQAVPAYQEFTGLIEELLVLAHQARLEITQINYATEKLAETSLLQFNLSFNVEGNYEQIKKFIYSLEQSLRLIAIKQIGLQSAEGEGVRLRLNLETYFKPGGSES